MLKMRLQRVGRTHEPSFRLVLTDSQNSTKSGRFKEILGSYDPRKTNESLNADRIKYWLSQGATPTVTVNNLLINHNIISGVKMNASSVSKNAQVAKREAKVKADAEAKALEETRAREEAEKAKADAEAAAAAEAAKSDNIEEAPAPAEAPVESAQ